MNNPTILSLFCPSVSVNCTVSDCQCTMISRDPEMGRKLNKFTLYGLKILLHFSLRQSIVEKERTMTRFVWEQNETYEGLHQSYGMRPIWACRLSLGLIASVVFASF